jgi:hypothetical protein
VFRIRRRLLNQAKVVVFCELPEGCGTAYPQAFEEQQGQEFDID